MGLIPTLLDKGFPTASLLYRSVKLPIKLMNTSSPIAVLVKFTSFALSDVNKKAAPALALFAANFVAEKLIKRHRAGAVQQLLSGKGTQAITLSAVESLVTSLLPKATKASRTERRNLAALLFLRFCFQRVAAGDSMVAKLFKPHKPKASAGGAPADAPAFNPRAALAAFLGTPALHKVMDALQSGRLSDLLDMAPGGEKAAAEKSSSEIFLTGLMEKALHDISLSLRRTAIDFFLL